MVVYTGNHIKMGFAQIGDYHIDAMPILDFFIGESKNLYETITEKHQVVLLDNIYLPFYYGVINRKEYYIKYFTYTEDEMKSKLSENYEKFILSLQEKGVQIVEKNVKMEKNSKGMDLHGDLLVVKQTGETVAIQADSDVSEEIEE